MSSYSSTTVPVLHWDMQDSSALVVALSPSKWVYPHTEFILQLQLFSLSPPNYLDIASCHYLINVIRNNLLVHLRWIDSSVLILLVL